MKLDKDKIKKYAKNAFLLAAGTGLLGYGLYKNKFDQTSDVPDEKIPDSGLPKFNPGQKTGVFDINTGFHDAPKGKDGEVDLLSKMIGGRSTLFRLNALATANNTLK